MKCVNICVALRVSRSDNNTGDSRGFKRRICICHCLPLSRLIFANPSLLVSLFNSYFPVPRISHSHTDGWATWSVRDPTRNTLFGLAFAIRELTSHRGVSIFSNSSSVLCFTMEIEVTLQDMSKRAYTCVAYVYIHTLYISIAVWDIQQKKKRNAWNKMKK